MFLLIVTPMSIEAVASGNCEAFVADLRRRPLASALIERSRRESRTRYQVCVVICKGHFHSSQAPGSFGSEQRNKQGVLVFASTTWDPATLEASRRADDSAPRMAVDDSDMCCCFTSGTCEMSVDRVTEWTNRVDCQEASQCSANSSGPECR